MRIRATTSQDPTTVISALVAREPVGGVLRDLVARLPQESMPYVIGGALRDAVCGIAPKDLDVVVGRIDGEALRASIAGALQNYFGGLTYRAGGVSVDVWPLPETYHVARFNLEPTIENVLAGAPFNLDKIAFDLRSGSILDDGALSGIELKKIVYAPKHPYLEHIQAIRCVLLQRKTGFTLDQSAHRLLVRVSRDMKDNRDLKHGMHEFLRGACGIDDAREEREILTRIAA